MTIYSSPFESVPLRKISITERLFEGLDGDRKRVVVTDGMSGRQVQAGELKNEIQRFAGGLRARGQGKGAVTAIMAPNVPEYITVFHGIAYAAGTVTTINPTYTAEEAQHQLKDSGASLLVTVPQFIETATAASVGTGVREIIVIGEAPGATSLAAFMGEALEAQEPVDVAHDIVALPYSSGTTGLPKGVMLSHQNLVVNVDQSLPLADIQPGDTTIAFLPFFHIYGLTVMMNLYLAHGAALVTMPRFDLERFLQLIAEHRPRALWCVPPVAIAMAKHPLVDDYDTSSVEVFCSAAAPLGAELGQAVAERLGCVAIQGYGMTELSPVSHLVRSSAPRPGACGETLPNTECRIVDPENGTDCNVGTEGELWVRGPQVMQGYLNNPAATAETVTADGWLKTGDLASFDADGYMFIHDRLKELIKVKGFQVAPAELEAVILQHDAIADAAVVGQPDEESGERPVAYVVCKPGAVLAEGMIEAHVAAHLANYKHLAAVHQVDSIPKSASGKILRRVLRQSA